MPPPEDEMGDLDRPATRRDLADFATKRDIAELREATRRDVDDLHRHFDVVVESFKAEFRNLFDWVHATTSTLGSRVEHLADNHGGRLLSLETRVTRIEKR